MLLDSKEIKPVHPKGNQSWIFIGKTDAEAETLILWPPNAKNWLIGKDPDAGKDWRWEEKGMTEDEMVGWDHRLDRRESEQAPGVCDWQGNLVCCSPRVTKSQTGLSDWTKLILHCITNQKASLIVYSDTKFHLWSGLSCPRGMRDLSSLTRGWTHIPCIGRWILNHWTTREVPAVTLFLKTKLLGEETRITKYC